MRVEKNKQILGFVTKIIESVVCREEGTRGAVHEFDVMLYTC